MALENHTGLATQVRCGYVVKCDCESLAVQTAMRAPRATRVAAGASMPTILRVWLGLDCETVATARTRREIPA